MRRDSSGRERTLAPCAGAADRDRGCRSGSARRAWRSPKIRAGAVDEQIAQPFGQSGGRRIKFLRVLPRRPRRWDKTLWEIDHAAGALAPRLVSVTYWRRRLDDASAQHATVKRILGEGPRDAGRAPDLRGRDLYRDRRGESATIAPPGAPHRGAAWRYDRRIGDNMSRITGGYQNAADLVGGSSALPCSKCRLSAYHEKASRQPDRDTDMRPLLAAKVDAGASVRSEVLFENDLIRPPISSRARAWASRCRSSRHLPVAELQKRPGALTARCGASVPDWLANRFAGLDDDARTEKLIAGRQ